MRCSRAASFCLTVRPLYLTILKASRAACVLNRRSAAKKRLRPAFSGIAGVPAAYKIDFEQACAPLIHAGIQRSA
jgi:hypothetical protein